MFTEAQETEIKKMMQKMESGSRTEQKKTNDQKKVQKGK